MRYHVILDPNERPPRVDIVDLPNEGASDARVGGEAVQVDVMAIGRQLNVRVGGQVVDLTIDGTPPDVSVVATGQRYQARVESDRGRSAAVSGERGRGPREHLVRSPMPGRVVKVLVAPGEAVEPGQGLVVLEAMKMENELRARIAGIVATVHVTEGMAVDGNATLITLAGPP